jgi:hypothetical protein
VLYAVGGRCDPAGSVSFGVRVMTNRIDVLLARLRVAAGPEANGAAHVEPRTALRGAATKASGAKPRAGGRMTRSWNGARESALCAGSPCEASGRTRALNSEKKPSESLP